jgi:Protein of unknown function (DUF2612)
VSGDIQPFLDLVTSEHASRPNFLAFISIFLQGQADAALVANTLPSLFDLDFAVGVQLDATGQWIGRTRYLPEPVQVYFSWNVAGLGWGQGIWKGPDDPVSGLVRLNDTAYRTLLYAVSAANQWDGTIPGAYAALNILFQPLGYTFLIQDNGNMSMLFALMGPPLDALITALFVTGQLDLKPATVTLHHVVQSIPGATPFFGWGLQNASIGGWGRGAWGIFSDDGPLPVQTA